MAARMEAKTVFSTHEVARVCSVTPMTVIRWIEHGKLPAFKTVGGHRRIRGVDLALFCRTRGIPVPDGGSSSILLVDADDARRRQTAAMLREEVDGEITIVEAKDLADARRQNGRKRPVLIVADVATDRLALAELVRQAAKDGAS
jgi:excisionase family DNA binding protein